MIHYKFGGGSEQQVFGPLPAGDYGFEIAHCEEPYEKNDKWILPVRIVIKPQGLTVFANAWTGKTRDGEMRDGIGDLLLCVNRAPAIGQRVPDWRELIGAKGRCRLKIEIAQQGALAGKEKNAVAFWHKPKELKPQSEPVRQSYSPQEVEKASKTAQAAAGGGDIEPDDIPF